MSSRVLPVAFIMTAHACASRPPLVQNAGASTVNPSVPDRAVPPMGPLAPTLTAPTTHDLEPATAAFPSRGHFVDGRTATIATNHLAAEAYGSRASDVRFAVGSLLVETHHGAGGDALGPRFFMEKREPGYFERGGDWDYAVVRSDGSVEAQGRLDRCARCHADAPSGWVFRRR